MNKQNPKVASERSLWLGVAKAVAHDMGTPLSSIMGWLELLPDMKDPTKVIREINRSLTRLNQLSLRLEQLGPPVKLEQVSLAEIVKNVRIYFEKRVAGSDIVIRSEIKKDLQLPACPELLEWALENLIRNAVDALTEPRGEIIIQAEVNPQTLSVLISDTGQGIREEDYKTVFVPGYTTKRSGRGVGLTLVRYIIEEIHKGRVEIETSHVSKGTTIRMELPR